MKTEIPYTFHEVITAYVGMKHILHRRFDEFIKKLKEEFKRSYYLDGNEKKHIIAFVDKLAGKELVEENKK